MGEMENERRKIGLILGESERVSSKRQTYPLAASMVVVGAALELPKNWVYDWPFPPAFNEASQASQPLLLIDQATAHSLG
jgi:hypothetical protein